MSVLFLFCPHTLCTILISSKYADIFCDVMFIFAEISCSTPENVPNGKVGGLNYTYGSSITYKCDPGFNHTSGNLTRTCLANGHWSGSIPNCSGKECLFKQRSFFISFFFIFKKLFLHFSCFPSIMVIDAVQLLTKSKKKRGDCYMKWFTIYRRVLICHVYIAIEYSCNEIHCI